MDDVVVLVSLLSLVLSTVSLVVAGIVGTVLMTKIKTLEEKRDIDEESNRVAGLEKRYQQLQQMKFSYMRTSPKIVERDR